MAFNQNVIQTNLTTGELSPRLRGRVDVAKYYNGVKSLLNMTVFVHGGATRRVGSYFVSEVKDSSKKVRIYEFIFSTTQNYILEFGDQYMRVYRARSQVVETGKTITAATQANPVVITSAGHGYNNGDQIYISGVVGMTQLNRAAYYSVANVTANTFELQGVNGTGYAAYSSGGSAQRIFTVATPWGENDLVDLKFTQSADVLYVCHPNYQPRKISRTGDTAWTVDLFPFKDGPYLEIDTTAPTLSIVSPPLTDGATSLLNSASPIFALTDVGRLIRVRIGGNTPWGYLEITAFGTPTQVTITAHGNFPVGSTIAGQDWRWGAWSGTTGWPTCATFFQERLVFGGNRLKPQTLWGSVTNDFENFRPTDPAGTVSDSDAFNFTIASDQVNAIRWLSAGKGVLLVGTSDAEHLVFGGSAGGYSPITPTNVAISNETTHGSVSNVRPLKIGNNVLFVQPSRRKVRSTNYQYQTDSYVAEDITLLSEHITNTGVIDAAYQKELDSFAWFPRTDGTLLGCTYEQAQQVTAWHRHQIGGNGVVESVGVIPNPTATYGQDLWILVRRTINGVQRRFIEYINSPFDPVNNGQQSAFFLDAGLTYNGYLAGTLTPGATSGSTTFTASSPVFTANMVGKKLYYVVNNIIVGKATITAYTDSTHVTATITLAFPSTAAIPSGQWCLAIQTISGADHLNGATVQVLADGATHPDITISNGSATLNDFYGMVHVGFSYISEIALQPPEIQVGGVATVQGRLQRIKSAVVYLYQSLGLKFGKDAPALKVLPFRSASDIMNAPVPLFTGTKRLTPAEGFGEESNFMLRQDQPLPMTVLFVTRDIDVGE